MGNIKFTDVIKYSVAIILTVVPVLTSLIAIDSYLENKIKTEINRKEYIDKVARSLRPFLIFNKNSNVIYNHGAKELIDKITVTFPREENIFSEHIIITVYPKEYLQNAPLLECLSSLQYLKEVKRKDNISWQYELDVGGHNSDLDKTIFRLELLK